jgi:hypothetical protein
MKTCAEVRADLISSLALDLVGPDPSPTSHHALHAQYANETLSAPPSRFYLTGFLVPFEASDDQKVDPTGNEELADASADGGTDDDETPEPPSARRVHFPSSIGLSVLVPGGVDELAIRADWGDYRTTTELEASGAATPAGAPAPAPAHPDRSVWQRKPEHREIIVSLAKSMKKKEHPLEDTGGLKIVISTRRVPAEVRGLVRKGTRAVSIFLVNDRPPAEDGKKDEAFAFQAQLTVHAKELEPRPNLRGRESDDWDERVSDLQYRDAAELAVGHGVATHAACDPKTGACNTVVTRWMPLAEVEKVVPDDVAEIELAMDALAAIATPAELAEKLRPLVAHYDAWIKAQSEQRFDHSQRDATAVELLRRAKVVNERVSVGIELLAKDALAFEAFRLTNRAMAMQQRRRALIALQEERPPKWRPFQLAFLLLNLAAIVDPAHHDREIVDLLFFPTGGGKTEAYLGLAAFAIVLRRLRDPSVSSSGVTVLMRYTLRLLTLDQLSRAATLISGLELIRQEDVEKLGRWPFEIGLWVGQAATPNRMGKKGDNDRYSARARTIAYQNDDKKPMPIPIESCPWCGSKFGPRSFVLLARGKPNNDHPTDLRVQCLDRLRRCDFHASKDMPLPILAVDEPIYRRLPAFLIATVDKFAGLPWVGQAGVLLGKVERCDEEGFYGAADPNVGHPLTILPPDLVIQDELHLISGPLGTMAGLYETAIDALASRSVGDKRVRPKVIASTATVRRADKQIQALFTRREVEVFPPPGPNARDSFFAKTVPPSEKNARLYLGIAAQGRSPKFVLLRTYLALLGAAQRAYIAAGGAKNPKNSADPYMTVLGYFGSLRELGGSRRIVEDEVLNRLAGYSARVRSGERQGLFANRKISFDVLELTSRVDTSEVAEAKRRLALPHADDEHVDVALATNMISVGLDITRLGLMAVLGQPKTAAEYIQATSRVGRDDERPGLVVALLNVHRPRDRSHYERFEAFHASFYRSVEATSVTPFAPRAVDRGLAGVAVAIARHGLPELTAPMSAVRVEKVISKLDFVAETLASRAVEHDRDRSKEAKERLREKIHGQVMDLLHDWAKYAHEQNAVGAGLQYQRESGGAPPLLHDPLDPVLAQLPKHARRFKAGRSLRDVEPSVNLWAQTLDGHEVEIEELDP